MQILQIDCAWKGQPPFAKQDFNYHHKLVGPTRTDIKPLNIVQPEGPSFSVSPTSTCLLRHSPQIYGFANTLQRCASCPGALENASEKAAESAEKTEPSNRLLCRSV